MIKEDLNTKYSYILVLFNKLINYQHITTVEFSHGNCTTKIDYAANAAEFKETSHIYM